MDTTGELTIGDLRTQLEAKRDSETTAVEVASRGPDIGHGNRKFRFHHLPDVVNLLSMLYSVHVIQVSNFSLVLVPRVHDVGGLRPHLPLHLFDDRLENSDGCLQPVEGDPERVGARCYAGVEPVLH